MSKILEWAEIGRQQNPQVNPIGGGGLDPSDIPRWQGNQLTMPGLGALLTGQGSAANVGGGGGSTGGGSTGGGGGVTLPPATGGGGGGAGGGSNPVNIAYEPYFNLYPGLQSAYQQSVGNPDATYIAQGYPQGPGGWAQFHWDTYGQNEGRQFFPVGSGGLTV